MLFTFDYAFLPGLQGILQGKAEKKPVEASEN